MELILDKRHSIPKTLVSVATQQEEPRIARTPQ